MRVIFNTVFATHTQPVCLRTHITTTLNIQRQRHTLTNAAAHYNGGGWREEGSHYHFAHKTRWASPLPLTIGINPVQFDSAYDFRRTIKANTHGPRAAQWNNNDLDRCANISFQGILTLAILFPIDISQTLNRIEMCVPRALALFQHQPKQWFLLMRCARERLLEKLLEN